MIYIIVSVYDRAAAAYGRPVFTGSEGQALRSFSNEVNRAEAGNDMHHHCADFDLYHLGQFSDVDGQFLLQDKPRLLVNGRSVLVKAG